MPKQFLTAEWRMLLMLNYEIDPQILQPLVPVGTQLDFWNGKTFVSMVGFRFLKTRVRGWAIPFHTNFDEINLRFYVSRQAEELRRGVVFIKEVVPRWAIAQVARWVYNENYVCCPMRSTMPLAESPSEQEQTVEYSWKGPSQWNRLSGKYSGTLSLPEPGSEEEFITEHYWGYCSQRDGSTMEYRVAHPQWRVWQAKNVEFDCAVQEFYGSDFTLVLSQKPSSAFIADGSGIEVFAGGKI